MDYQKYLQYGKGTSESVFIAALTNDAKYLIHYFESEGNIGIKDERGQTLLHLATRNKAIYSLALLLLLKLDPNQGDKYGDTPLHIAAYMGNNEIVTMLLEHDADPNCTNHVYDTPLHKAAYKGSVPCMQTLLAHHADLHLRNETHTSVLQHAVRSKKIKAVKYLLEQGAIINSLDNKHQSTLHYAAMYSTIDIATYLMEQGVNPYSKTVYKHTPLHLAVEHPDYRMVEVFLKSGCTSYDKSKFNMSPYDHAVQKSKYEAIEAFNRLKLDQEYQSQLRSNSLTFAIVMNDFDKAVSLVPRSNVNIKDIFGNTPLFYAIMNDEPYLVEQLLKHDASIYNIDKMGLDAIYYAVLSEHLSIVTLILTKHKKFEKRYFGYTVLEYAMLHQLDDIYSVLQKAQ